MTLEEYLERVTDRDTFLEFVRALVEDRQDEARKERENPSSPFGAGANGWEHRSIERYLDAAHACAVSLVALGRGLPETPSWRAFAQFLYDGKRYE